METPVTHFYLHNSLSICTLMPEEQIPRQPCPALWLVFQLGYLKYRFIEYLATFYAFLPPYGPLVDIIAIEI